MWNFGEFFIHNRGFWGDGKGDHFDPIRKGKSGLPAFGCDKWEEVPAGGEAWAGDCGDAHLFGNDVGIVRPLHEGDGVLGTKVLGLDAHHYVVFIFPGYGDEEVGVFDVFFPEFSDGAAFHIEEGGCAGESFGEFLCPFPVFFKEADFAVGPFEEFGQGKSLLPSSEDDDVLFGLLGELVVKVGYGFFQLGGCANKGDDVSFL